MEPPNRGFHPVLEPDIPYTFIDTCVQIWPDADFGLAHKHGVASYAVTSWWPRVGFEEALEGIMLWHLVARRHPNILVACTADDIRHAKQEGKTTLILAAQDGEFIDANLHRLEAFERLGLRMLILAYNRTNFICDGCLDKTDNGLTAFGERVVEECNRLGLLIDCSHTGKRATLEIMERSHDPVVFSHSNAKTLVDNPRNIDDEQIKTCAASGGVIGTVCWRPLIFQRGRRQRPTIDDYVDHIDYIAQLLGNVDHIGIGTDFSLGSYPLHRPDPWGAPRYQDARGPHDDVVTTYPRAPERFADGFSNYAEITNVIDMLQERGYTEQDIGKVLGGNFLRVFDRVWRGGGRKSQNADIGCKG